MNERHPPFLKENLKTLAKHFPQLARRIEVLSEAEHLQVVTSQSGEAVLIKHGKSLHSRRDPQIEAESFVNSEPVRKIISSGDIPLVFGLGLGYHILALLRLTNRVIVYEPDIYVIREAFRHRDWRNVMPGLTILTQGDDLTQVLSETCSLLVHRPSERLARIESARLKALMEHDGRVKNSIAAWKILVVTPLNGGSLPVAHHVTTALKSLGHRVVEADMSSLDLYYQHSKRADITESRRERLRARLMNFSGEYLELLVEAEQPDLLLALAQAPLDANYLARIRSRGVATAFWFVEDYRYMSYFRQLAASYDFFFHIQGNLLDQELARLGSVHHRHLPLAADPDMFRPISSPQELAPFQADVSFMGAGYPNRRHFFSELLDFDFKIWGTEWDLSTPLGQRVQAQGRRVTTEETVLIYNAARINLNLHSSVFSKGPDRSGNFINPRTFEIASCGAFQLVDERDPLPTFFTPGVELDTFKNLDDLRQKINFYLDQPDLRKEFGDRARKKVLAEHTYQHRMQDMLSYIRSNAF